MLLQALTLDHEHKNDEESAQETSYESELESRDTGRHSKQKQLSVIVSC